MKRIDRVCFKVPPPTGLLCDLLLHPELSVLTNPFPSFSWIMNSRKKGDSQTVCQIAVAACQRDLKRGGNLLWDSGKVESAQSANVKYAGRPLPARSAFVWRVRVWNKRGRKSAWSIPQRVNTGEFDAKRAWPGESRWVQVESPNGENIWTFEDRPPVRYHPVAAVKTLERTDGLFVDFGRSAFAVPEIHYSWNPPEGAAVQSEIRVCLGEKADGDAIDRQPGGGVLFGEYSFSVKPGTHSAKLDIPRADDRQGHYLHSQKLPEHMPEVVPFRFLEIHSDLPNLTVHRVTQHALYSLFDEEASSFSCSDDRLNQVYDLCRYSTKANMFNGDYASSQRERMMYEADSYIHQMAHYAVDREFAVARYSLKNMIFHATWPTEWIFHAILMAHADYQHTGNTEVIDEFFPELTAKLLLDLADETELVSTRTGRQTPELLKSIHFPSDELRDIVDWPDGRMGLPETDGETDNYDFTTYNTVVNAFFYRALVLMSDLASATGRDAEAEAFRDRAQRVRAAFNKTFLNAETGMYVDGDNSSHSSLHANMFALCFGLVDPPCQPVVEFIKSKGMACGVYGANYLLEALFDAGEAEAAIGLLTSDSDRGWLNMLRVGATLTTEAWDNRYKCNNGWSHAWSASPAHIIPRKLMGVEPLSPGFETIRIAPQPGALSFAECKVPTIRGPVCVRWDQTPSEFRTTVEIPANTSARFVLPGSGGQVLLDGVPVASEQDEAERFIQIDSGRHTARIKNQ